MSDVLMFAVRLVELIGWGLLVMSCFVGAALMALVAAGYMVSWARAAARERLRQGYLDDCARKRWGQP